MGETPKPPAQPVAASAIRAQDDGIHDDEPESAASARPKPPRRPAQRLHEGPSNVDPRTKPRAPGELAPRPPVTNVNKAGF
jgi:hypothetical protein